MYRQPCFSIASTDRLLPLSTHLPPWGWIILLSTGKRLLLKLGAIFFSCKLDPLIIVTPVCSCSLIYLFFFSRIAELASCWTIAIGSWLLPHCPTTHSVSCNNMFYRLYIRILPYIVLILQLATWWVAVCDVRVSDCVETFMVIPSVHLMKRNMSLLSMSIRRAEKQCLHWVDESVILK